MFWINLFLIMHYVLLESYVGLFCVSFITFGRKSELTIFVFSFHVFIKLDLLNTCAIICIRGLSFGKFIDVPFIFSFGRYYCEDIYIL